LHFNSKSAFNQYPLQEEELIRRCQKAESKAQKVLYDRFADRMFRVSFRYIKNQVDAEDIIMMAFTKIFGQIAKFAYQGEGSLEGWIRKIVVNESLMWLRRRHNFLMSESIDLSQPEPEILQLSELEAKDILAMVAQLPTGYRTVFNLFTMEGYTHKEIGAMLEISENTSRSQLFKAKALLQKMLTQEGFQYGT
jgi:RNA polymerase sigma factor (sigma-70 family)